MRSCSHGGQWTFGWWLVGTGGNQAYITDALVLHVSQLTTSHKPTTHNRKELASGHSPRPVIHSNIRLLLQYWKYTRAREVVGVAGTGAMGYNTLLVSSFYDCDVDHLLALPAGGFPPLFYVALDEALPAELVRSDIWHEDGNAIESDDA